MATNTAVIVLCDEAVLIWTIPPLSPQPPDFFDHNPTHMPPPLFTIPFPDIFHHPARMRWNTISSWYFGSSHPLYFSMLCQDSKLYRFQINLKPDLGAASLHLINTAELIPHDFYNVFFQDHRICEDTLVSCWIYGDRRQDQSQCGVYMGITSPPFANGISHGGPAAMMLFPDTRHQSVLFLCPASGRLVRLDSSNSVAVLDFF
jgi:hypothetical protein